MIQQYKNQIRYWVAVTFGELETAHQQDVCELICPDCGMKTSINVSKEGMQSCYFCDGDLLNHEQRETEQNTSLSSSQAEFSQNKQTSSPSQARTQEQREQVATAQ